MASRRSKEMRRYLHGLGHSRRVVAACPSKRQPLLFLDIPETGRNSALSLNGGQRAYHNSLASWRLCSKTSIVLVSKSSPVAVSCRQVRKGNLSSKLSLTNFAMYRSDVCAPILTGVVGPSECQPPSRLISDQQDDRPRYVSSSKSPVHEVSQARTS